MPPKPPSTSYWHVARAPRYSLLLALPLLAAYQALAALLMPSRGAGVRNGAEVMLESFVAPFVGARTGVVVIGVVVLACVGLALRDLRRAGGGLRSRVFALMIAESAAWAIACGVIVGIATTRLLGVVQPHLVVTAAPGGIATMDAPTRLMLALGAGLYEELVFRVLLVGALTFGLRRVVGTSAITAGVVATLVGAFVFSLVHYVGAYGDTFTVQSFTFRLLAGLFFSALFVTRGFGITAWAHALYDVLVLLVL